MNKHIKSDSFLRVTHILLLVVMILRTVYRYFTVDHPFYLPVAPEFELQNCYYYIPAVGICSQLCRYWSYRQVMSKDCRWQGGLIWSKLLLWAAMWSSAIVGSYEYNGCIYPWVYTEVFFYPLAIAYFLDWLLNRTTATAIHRGHKHRTFFRWAWMVVWMIIGGYVAGHSLLMLMRGNFDGLLNCFYYLQPFVIPLAAFRLTELTLTDSVQSIAEKT